MEGKTKVVIDKIFAIEITSANKRAWYASKLGKVMSVRQSGSKPYFELYGNSDFWIRKKHCKVLHVSNCQKIKNI